MVYLRPRASIFRGYRLRPGFRYGPHFYGRYWGQYGRRWQGPISSAFVAWAQSSLATVFGSVVPQDGVFGPETREFVQRFQAQQGLPPTGDLDGATVAALQAVVSPQPPAQPSPPTEPPPPPPAFAVSPQDVLPPQPPPPTPLAPRVHRPAPPSGEAELAGVPAEAVERGRWLRDRGRIVLIGV
jgi:hypothetical protein